MLFDFATVVLYMILGIGFILVSLIVPMLVRTHHPYDQKTATYECGEPTIGPSWVRFNICFYIIALIFIVFDVEIVVLFPWATVFRQLGAVGLLDMVVFVGILMVGLAYVWVKGDLDWIRGSPSNETVAENQDTARRPSARKSA